MNGNEIIVAWNYGGTLRAIAGARTCELQTEADVAAVSSSTDGAWEHNLAGRKSWSAQVGYLYITDADVLLVLQAGNTFTLTIGGRNAGSGQKLTGQAVLRTCRVSAARGHLVQGEFAFVGTGPLVSI